MHMRDKLHPSFERLADQVRVRYPDLYELRIQNEISQIAGFVRGATELRGKKVIDLGAGSVQSTESLSLWRKLFYKFVLANPHRATQFEPWFCRIMECAGAVPFAVDIGDNSTEPFESLQVDILKEDALASVPDASFDFANNFFFTEREGSPESMDATSPALYHRFMLDVKQSVVEEWTERGLRVSEMGPMFRKRALQAAWAFDRELDKEVIRILKPGGVYVHNNQRFKKKGKRLIEF